MDYQVSPPVRLITSGLYTRTGECFSVLGTRRLELEVAVLRVGREDPPSGPLDMLAWGPTKPRTGGLWLGSGPDRRPPAGHADTSRSGDVASAPCTLLADS